MESLQLYNNMEKVQIELLPETVRRPYVGRIYTLIGKSITPFIL